jgi:hypothetical protein
MLSWSDGHGTGADVDMVDGRHGNLPRRWRGGRGNASPLHGVGGRSAADPRPVSVGRCSPSCRGQAVPDPPARCGRQTRPRSVWLPWSRDPHGDVRRRPCGHAARSGACRPQQGIPRPTRASASTDSFPVQTADRLAARGAAPAQRVATAGRTGSARTTSRRSYRPSGIHVRSVRVSRSVCRSTARSLCATVCTSTTR